MNTELSFANNQFNCTTSKLPLSGLWLCLMLVLSGNSLQATHIRGGEITYKRTSEASLTYEFTLTMYHDTGSPVRSGDGLINFGDGREVQLDLEAFSFEDGVFIGPNTEVELFKIKILHTYNAPGTYQVTYTEPNRNDEILNINLGNSTSVGFQIKSLLVIDPFLGINNSPEFNSFPIDFGFVGKTFTHNPWASDPEGDSLVYRLITPRTDGDTVVMNYLNPNNSEFYVPPLGWGSANESGDGPATYRINSLTGDLAWDAPGNLLNNTRGDFSEYTVAMLVEEWRKVDGSWRKLGFVSRDFLIIATPDEIGRPNFELPEDRLIIESETIQETINFQDPDGDPIKVEFFGEVFDLATNPMTITPVPGDFVNGPLSLSFEWTPLPEHARDRPYFVHLKITDDPVDTEIRPAVTYKTWILSFNTLPDVITSLDDSQPKFRLYPNPVSNLLKMDFDRASEFSWLAIYNSVGQQTLSLDLTSTGVKEIDVSQIPSGFYLAQIIAGGRIYRERFIKE